jgi:hypothetical protein
MKIEKDILDKLAKWLVVEINRLHSYSKLSEISEILFCARDLGIDSPRINDTVEKFKEDQSPKYGQNSDQILDAIRQQLIFFRFNICEKDREKFFYHWFDKSHIRGKDIITISFLVNLALHQQELLTTDTIEYVRNWFIRHTEINALSVRAWIPRCLELAGFEYQAKAVAQNIMLEMEKDGSWSNDLRRTLKVAYPLALSNTVYEYELYNTVDYINKRLTKGFAEGVTVISKIIKLYHALKLIPVETISKIQSETNYIGSIFLSHSSKDKQMVRTLANELTKWGINVWLDEWEIKVGEPIVQKIQKGLKDCEYIGVWLTKNSVESQWVEREWQSIYQEEVSQNRVKVIPLLAGECTIPLLLKEKKYADFRQNYKLGLKALLALFIPEHRSRFNHFEQKTK